MACNLQSLSRFDSLSKWPFISRCNSLTCPNQASFSDMTVSLEDSAPYPNGPLYPDVTVSLVTSPMQKDILDSNQTIWIKDTGEIPLSVNTMKEPVHHSIRPRKASQWDGYD